ncbi:two-component system, chemotaxis family, sensor kinase CheA [Candidatus Magnetomoraceae bacterium gMMP-15]
MSEINNSFFSEFLDDYFAESEEHLTLIRRSFLGLESYVGSSNLDKTLLDGLYRSFHTLKGLSAMVGINEAEEVAHLVETYMRNLSKGQIVFTSKAMGELADSATLLEQIITAYREKNPIPSIENFITKFNSSIQISSKSSLEEASLLTQDDMSSSLKPEDRKQLENAIKKNIKIWRFEFTPTKDLSKRGINVNNIKDKLQTIGEMIALKPCIKSEGKIFFEFIVASNEKEEKFAVWKNDGLSFMPYEIKEIQPDSELPASQLQKSDADKPATTDAISEPELPTSQLQKSDADRPAVKVATSVSNIVRVRLKQLDDIMQKIGGLITSRNRLERNLQDIESMVRLSNWRSLQETQFIFERQISELRETVTRLRLVPIGEVFERMHFVIRDLARQENKEIILELEGQDTEIDKFIVEQIMDPLLHLVRNAVSHGLETKDQRIAKGKSPEGRIFLKAFAAKDTVIIIIKDDGCGMDEKHIYNLARQKGLISQDTVIDKRTLAEILCTSGFSTLKNANLASGRGIGMSVVKNTVTQLKGSISLKTEPDRGTCFTIQLPLTMAILQALIVSVNERCFAVPLTSVSEVITLDPSRVKLIKHTEIIPYHGMAMTLVRLSNLFGIPDNSKISKQNFQILVLERDLNPIGIIVDNILKQQEIVVRSIKDPLVRSFGIAGATELGDGKVVLILDVAAFQNIKTRKTSRAAYNP